MGNTFNIRAKTIKSLEENIRGNLCDLCQKIKHQKNKGQKKEAGNQISPKF